jgi:hypothetical protein
MVERSIKSMKVEIRDMDMEVQLHRLTTRIVRGEFRS